MFCDAGTGGGWLPVDVGRLDADLLSLSPHRFFGPKGVGVLYRRPGLGLKPLIHGGNQEHGLRAGSVHVAGIAGAGVAAGLAKEHQSAWAEKSRALTDRLWRRLSGKLAHIGLNGPEVGLQRDPRHLNVSFEFVEGEALLLLLDLNGVAVTAATGCAVKNLKISPVLTAMGLDAGLALASVLFSPGPDQGAELMDSAVETTAAAVVKLRGMSVAWQEFLAGRAASRLK